MDTFPDPTVEQTAAALAHAFQGTPWTVTRGPRGSVILSLDVIDAQWWEFLRRAGWTKTFTFEVDFDPTRMSCSITDTEHELTWTAGPGGALVPSLSASRSVARGRVISYQRAVVATPFEGTVVDVRFSSESSRATLRAVLGEHGWHERMGTDQRIGLIVAGIGVGVALVGGVVAVVVTQL